MNNFLRSTRHLDGSIRSIFWRSPDAHLDYETILSRFFPAVEKKLKDIFTDYGNNYGMKIQVKSLLNLKKWDELTGENKEVIAWINTEQIAIDSIDEIPQKIGQASNILISRYDGFVKEGSGLTFKFVDIITIFVNKFRLIHGGCLNALLPKFLQQSKSIIQVKNSKENLCFLYAVCSCLLHPKKNRTRKSKYKNLLTFLKSQCKSISLPFTIKDVKQFEKHIDCISINIYGFEKNHLFPFHITKKTKSQFHCDLLLYKEHYYGISNLSPLICLNLRKNKRKMFVCKTCLAFFYNQKKFEIHNDLCSGKGVRYEMPSLTNNKMSFNNYQNIMPADFVMYCDIESIILKEKKITCGKVKTVRLHQPISAGGITICRSVPAFSSKPFIYTGLDCIEQLMCFIESEYLRVYEHILRLKQKAIYLTEKDIENFNNAKICEMCHEHFTKFKYKVKDHDHLTGFYRRALCNRCNLTYAKLSSVFHIFFHGLGNYDMHYIIQNMNRFQRDKVKIIPKTSEKYLSLKVKNLFFKDSYQFLLSSLSDLANNLKEKGEKYFSILCSIFKNDIQRNLCFQKGIYPYSYMDSILKMYEKTLPSKEHFTNDLTGDAISDTDYELAQKVWSTFECKNMKDYTELYLLIDIILLADVFENFRTNCILDYDLDPVFYFSTPHFTFDAFLKMTNVQLDLITDVNQYLFLCKAIRGGICQASKRYAKANNPQLENFQSKKKESYLLYIDANNLYGKAMTEFLPLKDFTWMEESELTPGYILSLSDTSPIGCFIECDLEYPECLHNLHSDYPLAPSKVKIKYNDLSPYAKTICDVNGLKKTTNSEKLMLTLHSKERYVLHYRNLKLYVQLGLKIKHIYRGIKFIQAPYIKPYIEFNSRKRAKSKNDFDISYYKLLINSLFGKTIERPENRSKVILTSSGKKHEKLVASLCYKDSKIINDNLVGVTMGYELTKVQKPFFIGATVLELSKWHMYNFYYNVLKKYFTHNVQLLYTDTDSFILYITVPNLYNLHLFNLKDYFDFSNYPTNHKIFSNKNKKVPGLFKDELGGKIMKEFVSLRSKMYSFVVDDSETKVAKGVKKNIIKKEICHADYIKCLKTAQQIQNDFKNIVSKNHQIFTFHQSKVSLSAFDDKRYLLTPIYSLPYGHKCLRSNKNS